MHCPKARSGGNKQAGNYYEQSAPAHWHNEVPNDFYYDNRLRRRYPPSATVFAHQIQGSEVRLSSGPDTLNPTNLPPSSENMTMDLAFVDFSYEPDESWLLGDDFDLNRLGSSIDTFGSPWISDIDAITGITETAIPGECSGESRNASAIIKDRWYSRPTLEGTNAHQISGRQDYQGKVDEAYRAGLSNRLRPQLHDSALPSTEFLVCKLCMPCVITLILLQNLCIKLYFAKFHPIFPIVHSASFRPSSENALLLLSICSLGALFVGSGSAATRGRAIFMKLNKTILASASALPL